MSAKKGAEAVRNRKPYSLRIRPGLMKDAQKAAQEQNRSVNNLIETALMLYLGRMEYTDSWPPDNQAA